MGTPSHSTPRASSWQGAPEGWGCAQGRCVALQPAAHTPWGLAGCHQLHTWPGTAAVACPAVWLGTCWALPGGSWASTSAVGIREGWQGCTCVWRGAGQPTAGEAALVIPRAVPVVGAAVGAGSSSTLDTLPRAEPRFGWREGSGFGMQPAWPHCSRLPCSSVGAADPWGRPRAPSAWPGGLQDTSPGSASTQRVQQPRVQHFSPELHAVSL